MRRLAFTMSELLFAIAVIVVLAGLLLPVMAEAKKRAGETVCVTNLHQLQLATAIYRTSYDGDGVYGPSDRMGLPPDGVSLTESLRVPEAVLRCSAPPNVMSPKHAVYMKLFSDRSPPKPLVSWADYVIEEREHAAIFADMNHGDRSVPILSPFFQHRSIAVRLSGELFQLTKDGSWGDLDWWLTPKEKA